MAKKKDDDIPEELRKKEKEPEKKPKEDDQAYQFYGGGGTEEEEAPENLLWLITFTDVMALMLTFFVLLYSMSVPTVEDWEEMTKSLARQFQKDFSVEWYEAPQDEISIQKIDFTEALNLNYLASIITDIVEKEESLQSISLIPQSDHLIISLPQELVFQAGDADVSVRGRQALFIIGSALANIRNRIEVIGHADPRVIQRQSGAFENNWELSLMRATNAAAVLKSVGYARPIVVRGLSSARYDELPEDMGEEERLNYSRRVDILIMQDDGSRRNVLDLQPLG